MCYALYRTILSMHENTVAHFTMEFVLLVSVHQFNLIFILLAISFIIFEIGIFEVSQ